MSARRPSLRGDASKVHRNNLVVEPVVAIHVTSQVVAAVAQRPINGDELATISLRPHLIWGPGDNHLVPRIINRARSGMLRRIGRDPKQVEYREVFSRLGHRTIVGRDNE